MQMGKKTVSYTMGMVATLLSSSMERDVLLA
jgi:hypothetical protein